MDTTLISIRRILAITGAFIILYVVLRYIGTISYAIFLSFAGVLVGIFLDGIANFISVHIRLSYRLVLTFFILFSILVIGLIAWFGSSSIISQLAHVRNQIPQIINDLKSWFEQRSWGIWILKSIPNLHSIDISYLGKAASISVTILGAISDSIIILLIGIFTAFDSDIYINSIIKLVPINRRERAHEILDAIGQAIRSWLLGRFLVMASIGVLTGLGLMIAKVPLAWLLGLITGLFCFVPFIGPVAAAIPSILVGLSQSTEKAILVFIIYTGIQILENDLLTPIIQQYVTSLPAALLISVQILFFLIGGILAILVATPITVAIVVLIQMIYVGDILDDRVRPLGAGKARHNS